MTRRILLITGGFRSLGRVVAKQAIEHGYQLALLDNAWVPADLRSFGQDSLVVPTVDLSNAAAAMQAAVDRVTEEFGRLDVLLNLAGSSDGKQSRTVAARHGNS